MVEAAANSTEDFLIDGLSYKLKPGASYVNDRRSVSFHPQGSNIYSTNGTKLIKLLITGDNWLDPSTFRVMFDLVNTDTRPLAELRTVGGAHSFFKRMRILCNGAIVEDIDDYNRVSEMFSLLTSPHSRQNVAAEAFGKLWNLRDWADKKLSSHNYRGIESGDHMTVLFKPLSGLFNQPKMIPLRYCPITIELELVSDPTAVVISEYATLPLNLDQIEAGPFIHTNCSSSWVIQNVQAKCDVLTLDNALDNSYAEHLLSGKSLPINFNTHISQTQSLLSGTNGQQKVRLNITRSLSRLKSAFVSLDQGVLDEAKMPGRKSWNDFYSPMHAYAGLKEGTQYMSQGEFEFQVQLGSKLYSEYPIRSHAEAFYQLRKTLGVQSSNVHNFDIDAQEYRNNKFILAIDFENVIEAGFTGKNTRAGDIMNIRFDHKDTVATNYAHSMHVVLHADCIMEIRDGGITVLD